MKNICIALLLSIVSFTSCRHVSDTPVAEKGVLDLRNVEGDFSIYKLKGEWEFYWKRLLPPDQFVSDPVQGKIMGSVPSYWTNYADEIPDITPEGYGTYRLIVLLPGDLRDTIGLDVPVFDTSFKLFLNGKPSGGNGVVGVNSEESVPKYRPYITDFAVESDTLEIVIQVSNYFHRRGGFWKVMSLGDSETLHARNERKKVLTYSTLGILLAFSLFFMAFKFMNRKENIMFFFSLSLLGIFLRTSNTVLFPVNWFADISWTLSVRLEYIGTFIGYIFGMLYMRLLFPSKLLKKITTANTILFTILAIPILFLPVKIFSFVIMPLQIGVVVFLTYFTIRSFLGVLKFKIVDTIFFVGVFSMLISIVNDTLISMSSSAISNDYLSQIVFQLFILLQAVLLISQWIKDYRERIALQHELENINRNLEQIIDARTAELHGKNRDLENSLNFRNKLFSIIAHDLKSPISSVAQYTDLLVKSSTEISEPELTLSLREMAYSSIDLIDNLLYWGLGQGKQIQYHPVMTNLNQIITEMIHLYRHGMEQKKIEIEVYMPEKLLSICDPVLASIILRNILNNSIKFTPKNGKIEIIAVDLREEIKIGVKDSGKGMEEEKINEILQNDHVSSSPGTQNEKGTGLGLQVVKDLVALNKGKLSIKSEPGNGTLIEFTLPGYHEK